MAVETKAWAHEALGHLCSSNQFSTGPEDFSLTEEILRSRVRGGRLEEGKGTDENGFCVPSSVQEIIFQPRSLFPSGFPARRVASPPPAPEKRSKLRLSPALSFPHPLPDSSAIGKEGTCESPQLGTQCRLPWELTMFVQKRSAHSVDRVQTPPVLGTSPQRGLEFSLSLFFKVWFTKLSEKGMGNYQSASS